MEQIPAFSPSEFVAVFNQTIEYAYPSVSITGELAEFKVSKNRWVYADLKDDQAKLRLFGTIYQLPGPLEDGMLIEVIGEPRLHPQFGFSVQIRAMRPVGKGSIRKAADLLRAKLEAEGLFDVQRKRYIDTPPERIGLVASEQSAGFVDFMKILNARWGGVEVELYDAQVQGTAAVESLTGAIQFFNQQADPVDVIVLIRGGGSADDLGAFSAEQVTRAVAASRIPTVVGVGHEVDISLAELAADVRASTPSNAAELLVPDRSEVLKQLSLQKKSIQAHIRDYFTRRDSELQQLRERLTTKLSAVLEERAKLLARAKTLLMSMHPSATLKRGYALVEVDGKLVSSVAALRKGTAAHLTVHDGSVDVEVQ